jgi:DNA repair exonuclease SbcCD ATPase subunit
MDERQKSIRELEMKKRENQEAQDRLFESLGELLFSRIETNPALVEGKESGASPPEAELVEYRAVQKEIGDSRDYIKTIENDVQKLKELDGEINLKEKQKAQEKIELSAGYLSFGEIILEQGGNEEALKTYQDQAAALNAAINAMEESLNELVARQEKGVFQWIGKNAQGIMLRSRLQKSWSSLRKLYARAGEKLSAPDSSLGETINSGEILSLREKIGDNRVKIASLGTEISLLKAEKRKLGETLGAEGNPQRKIQSLENHILHSGEELRGIYRRFGKAAAGPRGKNCFSALLEEGDNPLLEKAVSLGETIQETEDKIEKLKIAIAIDEGQGEIEKLQRAVEDRRRRIALEEKVISDLEEQIRGVEKHIENLREQL